MRKCEAEHPFKQYYDKPFFQQFNFLHNLSLLLQILLFQLLLFKSIANFKYKIPFVFNCVHKKRYSPVGR